MLSFDEYIRQGEPGQASKARFWSIAIGLQQVDGLTPSEYLIETAQLNIVGDIDFEEVRNRIDSYYELHPTSSSQGRVEEADKVSVRIAEILSEDTFTFSPAEYLSIHKRLFQGIYPFAGKIRDYNISKKEWVLKGGSVIYGSAGSLKATLEYDFEQEKKFNYQGLNKKETIEHLAHFIARLWQIHLFGEGNTRTIAIFFIKYLRTFGFEVNNRLFEENSLYFRNALVRANYRNIAIHIHPTNEYLLKFLGNLLLGESHILQNREMHVDYPEYEISRSKTKTSYYPTARRSNGTKPNVSEKKSTYYPSARNSSEKRIPGLEKKSVTTENRSEKKTKGSEKKPGNYPIARTNSEKKIPDSEKKPITPENRSEKTTKGLEKKQTATPKSSEKTTKGSEKNRPPIHKSSEKKQTATHKGSEKKPIRSEKSLIATGHGSEKKIKNSEKILDFIRLEPTLTIKELAGKLGISTRAVEKNLARLKALNQLKRLGSDKGGKWFVP